MWFWCDIFFTNFPYQWQRADRFLICLFNMNLWGILIVGIVAMVEPLCVLKILYTKNIQKQQQRKMYMSSIWISIRIKMISYVNMVNDIDFSFKGGIFHNKIIILIVWLFSSNSIWMWIKLISSIFGLNFINNSLRFTQSQSSLTRWLKN